MDSKHSFIKGLHYIHTDSADLDHTTLNHVVSACMASFSEKAFRIHFVLWYLDMFKSLNMFD